MDDAKKQAGPPQSLSKRHERLNKRRTHVVRRQAEKKQIEHPEDLACMAHMRYHDNW